MSEFQELLAQPWYVWPAAIGFTYFMVSERCQRYHRTQAAIGVLLLAVACLTIPWEIAEIATSVYLDGLTWGLAFWIVFKTFAEYCIVAVIAIPAIQRYRRLSEPRA